MYLPKNSSSPIIPLREIQRHFQSSSINKTSQQQQDFQNHHARSNALTQCSTPHLSQWSAQMGQAMQILRKSLLTFDLAPSNVTDSIDGHWYANGTSLLASLPWPQPLSTTQAPGWAQRNSKFFCQSHSPFLCWLQIWHNDKKAMVNKWHHITHFSSPLTRQMCHHEPNAIHTCRFHCSAERQAYAKHIQSSRHFCQPFHRLLVHPPATNLILKEKIVVKQAFEKLATRHAVKM